MLAIRGKILYSILIASVSASPIQARQVNSTLDLYSLPDNDEAPVVRAAGVDVKRATFTYADSGYPGPFSPTGVLGAAALAADTLIIGTEYAAQSVVSTNDSLVANVDTAKVIEHGSMYQHHRVC